MKTTHRTQLEIDADSGIAQLALNRPEALNAFDLKMFEELDAHISALKKKSTVRAVVISAIGKDFSTGLDIKSLMQSKSGMLRLGWNSPNTQAATSPGQSNSAKAAELNEIFTVQPQICTINAGSTKCEVQIVLSKSKSHCIFVKDAPEATQGTKVACGKSILQTINWISKTPKYLELRQGDNLLDSPLAGGTWVFGVEASPKSLVGGDDRRPSAALVNSKVNGSATSWDGRLLFSLSPTAAKVSIMRSERLDEMAQSALEDHELYSEAVTFAAPANAAQDIGIEKLPSHIAVFPDGSLPSNPYKSDQKGNADETGNYETYRFYAVMPSQKLNATTSPYCVNPEIPNTEAEPCEKKFFLTKFKARVTIGSPKTKEAFIHSTAIISKAEALTDLNGDLIHGYEPTTTLDGRLIIYSGNPKPQYKSGNGGSIMYTFHQNQHMYSGLTTPRNLATLYYDLGPGAPSERKVNGTTLFSHLYPIAAEPIKQYNGEILNNTGWIKGAYPWISFRGSEVFFQTRSMFHAAARAGATVVGPRTGWQLWRMDGEINNNRGNPTERFDHFQNTKDKASNPPNEYNAISAA